MSGALTCRLAVCALAACFTACIAIPHRGKVYGPAGKTGSVDLSFLSAGTTPDSEVRERLRLFDVQLRELALFWGRWRREWDVYWVAAGAAETSATAGSGTVTVWRRRNVLIEYDPWGYVSAFRTVGDNELLNALAATVRNARQPGQPRRELTLASMEGEHISWKDGRLSFGGLRSGAPRFTCELGSIVDLSVMAESTEDRIVMRLEAFVPRNPRKKILRRFSLSPRQVYDLVSLVEANGATRILH
jgi:hypothetical protein